MPTGFPNPQAGQTWTEQSAREWRNLCEEVRRLKGMIDRRGLNIPSGALPRGVEQSELVVPRDKTVVIVVKPLASHGMLTVREAKYANLPPVPCTTSGEPPVKSCHYTWHGDPFVVWPPMGKEPIDFDGDEYVQGTDDIAPVFDTVFHRCHREHDAWVLNDKGGEGGGGGGIIPGYVLDAPNNDGLTIVVQPMKRSGNSWVFDGPSGPVYLWGNQRSRDFVTLIDDIIPLILIGGDPYAMQYFWFVDENPNAGVPAGDCA